MLDDTESRRREVADPTSVFETVAVVGVGGGGVVWWGGDGGVEGGGGWFGLDGGEFAGEAVFEAFDAGGVGGVVDGDLAGPGAVFVAFGEELVDGVEVA